MALRYIIKKYKQHYVLYTCITAVLLCAVFLGMVSHLYTTAEEAAYENLHTQTKQIKDGITLQLISDQENLVTMANFAAKLYGDGEDYDLMFESFKPIGLIANIGILSKDNVFLTKAGTVDLNGLISFEEERAKVPYISGRINDVVRSDYEIIRSAVPINVNGETVGILYGVITLDTIGARYTQMAQELNAQLFVYDKETGELVIDTVHDELGNISFLKERKYNDGYSYEEMVNTEKGFTSFLSAYRNENMHLHYSTMEDIGWMIALARYDSQVFAEAQALSNVLVLSFLVMIGIIVLYILILMRNERRANAVTTCASEIRKILLETAGKEDHIAQALKQVCLFAKGRSAIFFNTDGEEYNYIMPEQQSVALSAKEKQFFMATLFRYAGDIHKQTGTAVSVLRIKRNKQLMKTNRTFYKLMKLHHIEDISLSATIDNANHIVILAVLDPKRGNRARMLADKIAACFAMALYNKNRYNKTRLAATTDALTGAMNRVAYKNDLMMFEKGKLVDFSCIYIDVNELHLRNNMYGHAAGDEMLIYIANTLKEVFYGHKVYRMGGDEFLVFCQNVDQDTVKRGIALFTERLEYRDYHVSVGMSYRTQNTNTDEMVREAEIRMYEEKARYYQNKGTQNVTTTIDKEYIQLKTGILEIDTMLSVMTENYNGIYRVSLDTDKAKRILMPKAFSYNEHEDNFSALFSKYVAEEVSPDYRRALLSFSNYDALKQQLLEGSVPRVAYKKNNGENVVLSVYKLGAEDSLRNDTLWVFALA